MSFFVFWNLVLPTAVEMDEDIDYGLVNRLLGLTDVSIVCYYPEQFFLGLLNQICFAPNMILTQANG